MTFQEYLDKTKEIALEECEILDEMSEKKEWSKVEIRAVKNSMQVIVENSIGKAKRILKKFNCPIVPQKGSDAFEFMYEMGLIEDELYSTMKSAIGLRNAMMHDYMNFNDEILKSVVSLKKYDEIIVFLKSDISYSDVKLKRIENFFLN
ncbi:MAG: HepT-like ribonuclease domain-containing protein [Campylobacterota bacterium]|nr:HepT-like ribonuclease domain-containing protein [Campylobacterota bacterium]